MKNGHEITLSYIILIAPCGCHDGSVRIVCFEAMQDIPEASPIGVVFSIFRPSNEVDYGGKRASSPSGKPTNFFSFDFQEEILRS